MALMTIGEFARRTRLSARALRIYDELHLVVPEQVDASTGYRLYADEQVGRARLVATLRRLDMPLAVISSLICVDGPAAALSLGQWWGQAEGVAAERRALVRYLQAQLRGEETAMYDVTIRSIPERRLLSISRHVVIGEADVFFADAFARLKAGGPGLEGITGAPFVVFHGEVSEDSDGPIELCRPVGDDSLVASVIRDGVDTRIETTHDEAYIRLAKKNLGWPALLPAWEALEAWAAASGRRSAGPVRQVLIADQRTADPNTLVCDLSMPLR